MTRQSFSYEIVLNNEKKMFVLIRKNCETFGKSSSGETSDYSGF